MKTEYPREDARYQEYILDNVRKCSNGWDLNLDGGLMFWCPGESSIIPHKGMLARLYGGCGGTTRGLFLNGQKVFYRTEAEQKEKNRKDSKLAQKEKLAKAISSADYRKAPSPDVPFDSNYHCAYCDKVFRISEQVEFLRHQDNCKTPEPSISEQCARDCVGDVCEGCGRFIPTKPAGPSKNMVEKVAQFLCLQDGLEWNWLKEQQRYHGEKDCGYYRIIALSILKLCQPELELMESNPYGERSKINPKIVNSDCPFEYEAYEAGKQTQLDHDRKQIKGEA